MAFAPLACVECGRDADPEARGWEGHLVESDDDGQDEVVFFCPRCAAREFGELRRRQGLDRGSELGP